MDPLSSGRFSGRQKYGSGYSTLMSSLRSHESHFDSADKESEKDVNLVAEYLKRWLDRYSEYDLTSSQRRFT